MDGDFALTELATVTPRASVPSVFAARREARTRMRDFFSSHIRNPNTRYVLNNHRDVTDQD
jgi:hypothetical protein